MRASVDNTGQVRRFRSEDGIFCIAFLPSDCVNLMLSISPTYLLYFLPLLLAISVVYGATRHEDLGAIIRHALQSGYWVAGFMGIIFLVLLVVGWMI